MSEKTLRDEFAMAALTGLLAAGSRATHELDAATAYRSADAMMTERRKRQSEKPAAVVRADDPRPANCKFRLMNEGKPYPKSGCEVCRINLVRECPHLPPSPYTFAHNRVTP